MKSKKFIGFIAVLAIAALAAFNLSLNNQESRLSDIALANINDMENEDFEGGNPKPIGDECFTMVFYDELYKNFRKHVKYCGAGCEDSKRVWATKMDGKCHN